MTEFKPLNLAQLYQAADASVAQAMQTNLLVLQSSRMKQEFDEEDQLRSLARSSTTTGPDGTPSFDLKGFTKGAYSVNPMKAMGFEKAAREAETAGLQKQKLVGDIDKQRREAGEKRLELMGNASSAPYLEYKKLVDSGVPEAEARERVQPLYIQGVQNLVSSELFTKEQLAKFDLKPQFDPAVAKAGMDQVMGASKALEQYWQEKGYNQRERFHQDTIDIQKGGQKITLRGQDLAQYEVDRDRGIVVHKSSGQSFPIAGPGGAPLPPKGENVAKLRDEFNKREEVKNYNAALPVLRAVSNAPDTAAGDLDFIYGVGKILDPGSVVREGEMALVIKSGTPLQRILGTAQWSAEQGGRLTKEQRGQLMEALNGRVKELHAAALDARKPFEAQAKRQNIPLDETLTLPELPKMGDGKGGQTDGKVEATKKIGDVEYVKIGGKWFQK